jgi:hypothetical protein
VLALELHEQLDKPPHRAPGGPGVSRTLISPATLSLPPLASQAPGEPDEEAAHCRDHRADDGENGAVELRHGPELQERRRDGASGVGRSISGRLASPYSPA